MVSIEKARKILWSEYDKYTDKQIEDLVLNYTILTSKIIDDIWENESEDNKLKNN